MDLAKFAADVLEAMFEGNCFDGFELQSLAVKCGILSETEYDPEKHGESGCDLEPGDDYFEFTPEFKAAMPQSF